MGYREQLWKKRERGQARQDTSRCPHTHKTRFVTHEAALQRAGEILTGRNPRATAFRAYRCDKCGGYHITSKP